MQFAVLYRTKVAHSNYLTANLIIFFQNRDWREKVKILKLKFKNLNSLKGEWSIDFTSDEFNSGIFAITGPTGSGKTTILDALCLGIYGRSPRETARKSENEIMSKGTGDCFSEVEFECNDFIYTTRFEQSRARKNPSGRLQDTICYLYKEENGDKKLVFKETATSKYSDKIALEIGLTYPQFTKSVLLAQGAFTDFLKSDKNNKTQILEKITKTDFFRKISAKIYAKCQEEQKKYDEIKNKKDLLKLLTEEEENSFISDLNLKEKSIVDFENIIKDKRNLKDIYNQKVDSENNLKDIESNILICRENLNKNEEDFNLISDEKIKFNSFYKEKMEKIRTALSINRSIQEKNIFLNKEKKSLQDESSSITRHKNEIKIAEENLVLLQEQKNDIELQLKNSEIDHALLDEFTLIKIKFDLLKEQNLKIDSLKAEIDSSLDKKNILEKELEKVQSERQNLVLQIENLKNKRIEEYKNASLVDIHEELTNLNNIYAKLRKAQDYLENKEKLSVNIENFKKQKKEKQLILNDLLPKLANSKNEHSELESKKEKFEDSLKFINSVMEYDEVRKNLQKNKPCPLCGSLEHPYVIESLPQPEPFKIKLTELKTLLKSKDVEIKEYIAKKSKIETEITFFDENIKSLFAESDSTNEKLRAICDEFKISDDSLLIELENRKKEIEKKEAQYISLNKIEREIDGLNLKLEKNNQSISNYSSEIDKIQVVKLSSEKNLCEVKDNIKNISSELNIYSLKYNFAFNDNAICELSNRKIIREETEKKFEELKRNISEKQLSIESLKNNLTVHLDIFSKLESKVKNISFEIDKLKNEIVKLFENEDSYSGSPEFEEEKLNSEKDNFEKEYSSKKLFFEKNKIELNNLLENSQKCKNTIKELSSKIPEKFDINLSESEILSLENKIKDITEEIGRIKLRLSDNEKVKLQSKKIIEELEERNKILLPWKMLNNLIGSKEGDKYQTFAQKITMSFLLKNANKYLERISGRYILSIFADNSTDKKEDKKDDMSLFVKDLEQGGIVRPVSNLSGGETFMISLALALGLSSMSRKNIKIDSLFIDEGFATLDEYSLANAIYVLNSLAGEGKTVGIISHVESLKDSIKTKIEIEKISEGKSRIFGAGVSNN